MCIAQRNSRRVLQDKHRFMLHAGKEHLSQEIMKRAIALQTCSYWSKNTSYDV